MSTRATTREDGAAAWRPERPGHPRYQNLGCVFAYNLAANPLAAAGVLNPVIAAAAMALSSGSVGANSLTLRRFRRATRAPTTSGSLQASTAAAAGHAARMTSRSALVLAAAIALPLGCGGDEPPESSPGGQVAVGDPGPIHVHGLDINPKDGALLVATHTGLFRAPEGDDKPERVGDRFHDTMDFTIVGPDTFLGSRHPDGRDKLPPFVGLIRSGRRRQELAAGVAARQARLGIQ